VPFYVPFDVVILNKFSFLPAKEEGYLMPV
jgi:hypothetical protein